MKVLFFVFGFLLFLVFTPTLVQAHSPGQLPFVLVNGKYTLFNPTYQTGTMIHSAQDMATGKYLVGMPVFFSIDLGRLPFPSSISDQFIFQWSVFQGNNFDQQTGKYVYGKVFSYTFTHPGSYMITVDAGTANSSYALIDSVLVNVFPVFSYDYPESNVEIQNRQTYVFLQNDSNFDPKAKAIAFVWDVGNGNLQQGKRIQTNVNLINNFPKTGITARVIDDHGFITDVLLRQETFTRQISYDTIRYANRTVKTQFGVVVRTVQADKTRSKAGFILALSVSEFVKNLLILFLSLLCLITLRVLFIFYGHDSRQNIL